MYKRQLVCGFICLAVSILIYAPFVIAASKSAQKQAEAEGKLEPKKANV